MQPLCVAGIDAGQRFLDLGLAPSGQTFRFKNAADDIARLIARLKQEGVARVVLEAVGSYAQPLVMALVEAGLAVGIVNPRRIKAFRDAEGRRAKTDRLDAQLIARFALVLADAVRPVPDPEAQALRALSTRRRQLSIPGIGERVGVVLLTELPELGRRDRKTIASLVGLAPSPATHRPAPPSPADDPASEPPST